NITENGRYAELRSRRYISFDMIILDCCSVARAGYDPITLYPNQGPCEICAATLTPALQAPSLRLVCMIWSVADLTDFPFWARVLFTSADIAIRIALLEIGRAHV